MPETTQAKPYRLLERMQIHGGIYAAGTILDLLPNEVTPQMQEVGAVEHLAKSLAGIVSARVSSAGAGFISLDRQREPRSIVRLDIPRNLGVRSESDLSGVNLMIFGTNEAGEPIDEKLRGPKSADEDVVSANQYLTVTGVASSGAVSGLTIDAMETAEEAAARVDFEDKRDRALYLKGGRTPDEDVEVERLLSRRKILTDQEKRTPKEEAELTRLNAVLLPVEPVVAAPVADPSPPLSPVRVPLSPAETTRLADLRALTVRNDAENTEMDALVARESAGAPPVPPVKVSLSDVEKQRLVTLRAMTARTPAEDSEMADLAARA